MRIEGAAPRARDERYYIKKSVKITTEPGAKFELESKDVSLSGMALSLNALLVDNGQFVQLHAEGLGNMNGKAARTYEGAGTIQFSRLLEEVPDESQRPRSLNKLA